MDTRSQIAEKVKELQEQNKLRAEQAEQAEREVTSGEYKSEPVVEQVKKEKRPKKKKERKKEVSVRREAAKTPDPSNEDKASGKENGKSSRNKDNEREKSPEAERNIPAEEPVQPKEETAKGNLNDSLKNMEKLLNEKDKTLMRDKGAVTSDVTEPAEKNEVKSRPRHRGPHAVGRTRVKYVDLEGRTLAEFGLIDTATGEVYTLTRDIMIVGKSQTANIVIENRYVSRRHLRITKEDGEYYIEDLGSKNGTFLNGERIIPGEKVQIEIGDTLTLAATNIIFDVIK